MLVLGCTHYPLLRARIERVYPGAFQMIDSATTDRCQGRAPAEHAGMEADRAAVASRASRDGVARRFNEVAAILFGQEVPEVTEVDLGRAVASRPEGIFGPVAGDLDISRFACGSRSRATDHRWRARWATFSRQAGSG